MLTRRQRSLLLSPHSASFVREFPALLSLVKPLAMRRAFRTCFPLSPSLAALALLQLHCPLSRAPRGVLNVVPCRNLQPSQVPLAGRPTATPSFRLDTPADDLKSMNNLSLRPRRFRSAWTQETSGDLPRLERPRQTASFLLKAAAPAAGAGRRLPDRCASKADRR